MVRCAGGSIVRECLEIFRCANALRSREAQQDRVNIMNITCPRPNVQRNVCSAQHGLLNVVMNRSAAPSQLSAACACDGFAGSVHCVRCIGASGMCPPNCALCLGLRASRHHFFTIWSCQNVGVQLLDDGVDGPWSVFIVVLEHGFVLHRHSACT